MNNELPRFISDEEFTANIGRMAEADLLGRGKIEILHASDESRDRVRFFYPRAEDADATREVLASLFPETDIHTNMSWLPGDTWRWYTTIYFTV